MRWHLFSAMTTASRKAVSRLTQVDGTGEGDGAFEQFGAHLFGHPGGRTDVVWVAAQVGDELLVDGDVLIGFPAELLVLGGEHGVAGEFGGDSVEGGTGAFMGQERARGCQR